MTERKENKGRIEVIVGSMFSGKSEELIRRVRRAEIARLKTQVFSPSLDNRYGQGTVNSHDGRAQEATVVKSAKEILEFVDDDTVVVAVDEGQFFDPQLTEICNILADTKNIRVIVAGLNLDFKGEPFHPMPEVMAMADHLDELHAICIVCGEEASRTQRMIKEQQADGSWVSRPARYGDPLIVVAADEKHAAEIATKIQEYYEARCRHCHEVPGKPE